MRVVRTHHVAIVTPNVTRLREFYVDVLGLPLAGGFEGENIVFVDAGTTLVELVQEAVVVGDRQPAGWNHLALEVEDVSAAFADLTARGIPFEVQPEDFPPAAPKLRIAFLRDPDGNSIELVQPLGGAFRLARDARLRTPRGPRRSAGNTSAGRRLRIASIG